MPPLATGYGIVKIEAVIDDVFAHIRFVAVLVMVITFLNGPDRYVVIAAATAVVIVLTLRGRAYTLAFLVADDDPGALAVVRFLVGLQEDIGPGCAGVAVEETSVGGNTNVMDLTLGVGFLQGVGAQGVESRRNSAVPMPANVPQ